MLCSSMKLTDRKEEAKRGETSTSGRIENSAEFMMQSDYCHSYSFRWDKPKLFYNCDSPHSLTVNNIILPEDTPAFNTGSSIEKWSKKRPRLKSSGPKTPGSSSDVVSEDNFDVAPLIEEISKDATSSSSPPEANELDPDVKNLLLLAVRDSYGGEEEEEEEEDEVDRRRRREKKHRRKRKDKSDGSKEKGKKKKKAIKFSLSKPPSPQTVQVIRVEVTSNYSMEEVEGLDVDVVSDCSKGCGLRIKSADDLRKSLTTRMELEGFNGSDDAEIMIRCNKLVLCNRK